MARGLPILGVQVRERLMRKRHWLAGLLSGWLSLVGGQVFAQSPPFGQGYANNPDMSGMPAPYTMNYGRAPEQYSGMQGGYPPGANAWPNVSPYAGPAVDQTLNENGMWFRRIITGDRRYYFTAEALIGNTNQPNALVGAAGVNVIPASAIPQGLTAATAYPDNTSQFQQTPAGTSTIGTPDRELTTAGGGAAGGGNNANGTGSTSTPGVPFGAQATNIIPNDLFSTGFRGTWGFWNPDDSGFQASVFWMTRGYSSISIGDPFGFNQTLYTDSTLLQTNLLNNLHAVAGIPLGGADTDHNGLPGVVQPFDIYYRLQYQTQVGGANADWIASPMFERNAFKFRPVVGARYMQVNERFTFDGADSGLGYTINPPNSGGAAGQVGGVGAGAGGAGTTGSTGNLSPVTLEAGTTLNVMYSLLSSSVTTQLAGPEAGFRLDLGSERFGIWTNTKLGLLVNESTRTLGGYNIGDAYYPLTNGTVTNPTAMPRNNAAATGFSSQSTTTSMSPLFEQSIFAKTHVFQFIPVLNKSKILSNAEFQAGFTAIFIGNMYRPSNDINWQAYPVNPQLADHRSTFFTNNYSFGVNWQY